MKERFLPFTSDRSDLKILKEKLWQGGHGIPVRVLVGMLLAIEVFGLSRVRERLASFSNCESWLETYEKFIAITPSISISFKTAENLKALQDLVLDDDVYLNFVDYFTKSTSKFAYFTALTDKNLTIPEGMFSDSGEPFEISSKAEIYAFITYITYIEKTTVSPKRLVLKGSKNDSF